MNYSYSTTYCKENNDYCKTTMKPTIKCCEFCRPNSLEKKKGLDTCRTISEREAEILKELLSGKCIFLGIQKEFIKKVILSKVDFIN